MNAGELTSAARRLRRKLLDHVYQHGGGHIGGSLSAVELLVTLYHSFLRFPAGAVPHPERDRFILSKGHCAIALYHVLAERGLLPAAALARLQQPGSELTEHPELNPAWGIEATTGSLGHGLPIGCGLALAAQRRGASWRTVVLLGDGECQEGSVWEAALFAAQHHLRQLIAIVDHNRLQAMQPLAEVIGFPSLPALWTACGWQVSECDGHDPAAIVAALTTAALPGSQPVALIAHTVKGKGVSYMEGQALWHYRAPSAEEYAQAVRELSHA